MSSRYKEARRDTIRISGRITGKAKEKVKDNISRAKVRRAGKKN